MAATGSDTAVGAVFRRGDVLRLAACGALAGGFVEGLVFCGIRLVPDWLTWEMRQFNVSADILWVAPWIYLIPFLLVGVLWAGTASWWMRLPLLRRTDLATVSLVLFGWLAFLPVIHVTGRIRPYASCLLALGLAAQLARWCRRAEPARLRRLLGAGCYGFGLITAGIAATTAVWSGVREASQLRHLARPGRNSPNVLLIVLDTLRADHLSGYGYRRQTTRNLDALAQKGVVFENAFAPSSWTVPSHASLVTGRLVHEHGADAQRPVLSKRYPTLAEVMAAHGYGTAAFSANTWWLTRNSGFDRGFHHFEDYFCSVTDMIARTVYGKLAAGKLLPRLGYRDRFGRKRAGDINRAFLRWLDARQVKPFFVLLNYVETHAPYVSPSAFHTRFMDPQQRAREPSFTFVPPNSPDGSADTVSLLAAGYDGSLAFLDAELQHLFDQLRLRGLLDDTLVVLTSDHGESLGDHGLFQHGNSLYREQIRVPLIVSFPQLVPAPVRIAAPVSLRDIPVTVTSLLFPGEPSVFPGRSLAELWSSPTGGADREHEPIVSEIAARDGVPRAWPNSRRWVRSLVTAEWHLIRRQDGKTELYRLTADPAETHNLADTPSGRVTSAQLGARLEAILSVPDSDHPA
ncbi:MAG: sulfatase [Deltaproteobacteria bacterium]|nr:sulfatase [Deltaproteobacteria bacterium]